MVRILDIRGNIHRQILRLKLSLLVGIAIIGVLHQYWLADEGWPVLYAAMGALATLVFALPDAATVQPRSILFGSVVPSLMSVLMFNLFREDLLWLSAALSCSLSVALMEMTGTVHPPGGALSILVWSGALLTVPQFISSPQIQPMGYRYVLGALFGSLILFCVGLFVNNLPKSRKYPEYWV